MLRSIIITVFLLLSGLALSFAQPKIEIVGGDTYNWNKVTSKDDPLKANIKIKNAGTKQLIISEVKPACGCTTAEIKKKKLKPGETTILPVTLKIGGYDGRITKTIKITSNDPVNKDKILNLRADIYNLIDIIPGKSLTFGEMQLGKESATSVIFKNNSEKAVTFSGFTVAPADYAKLNVSGDKNLNPGEEFELIITAKPTVVGFFTCYIKIKTSHPDYQDVSVSCYGKVKE